MSSQSDFPEHHIVAVTLAFYGGGPERDTVLLCNALASRGLRVTVLVLRNQGPLRSLVDPRIEIVDIRQPRMRGAIGSLRRAIRSLAPTIVLSSGVPCLNLLALIAVRSMPPKGRPKLIIRESAVPSMARYDPSWSNRIAYRVLVHLYRYADRIATLTKGARRELIERFGIRSSLVTVMRPNAVNPPTMMNRLANWDGESGREDNLIVCVGRLSAEKDQRTLLRALTLMPPERDWRLAIIGDGPDRAELEAFVRDKKLTDRTVFTGYVSDPFAWIMRARVLVLPSLYEGLGNTIIEALACGTLVVSTDCRYGPREILEDGRYGILTPVGDAQAMAKAIELALDSAPNRQLLMRQGCLHSADNAAAGFLKILSELSEQATSSTRSLFAPTRRSSEESCFRL